MNPRDIREALAATIKTWCDTAAHVYAYDPGGTTNYPRISIALGEPAVEYHKTYGGRADLNLVVLVQVVGQPIDRAMAIDDYIAERTGGIRYAIEQARGVPGEAALGGLCDDVVCDVAHAPSENEAGALEARFDVRVIGAREA